jgi:hypothetical protein
MSDEKTIFIRCSAQTNDLLEAIRKFDMPPRSRNSQIIHLIHKEADRLGISVKEAPREEPKVAGLLGLAERAKLASPR